MSDNWRLVFVVCFMLVYFGLIVGGISLARRRRKSKWPFKASDKLLRGPGEGLRRRIAEIDETFVIELGVTIAIAAFAPSVLLSLAKGAGLQPGWQLAVTVAGLVGIALLGAWRVTRVWQRRSNYFLGWFGERAVAEKLQPLLARGYRVFHDVPAEPGEKGFNLDHVVVGPSGVVVVEVKTRRKGKARIGYKDHEVSFDGAQLDWPWGKDGHGVQQAINEAQWLEKWIHKQTGLSVAVRAVLTLPGWFVRESPSPRVRVVNPNFLPDVIVGRGESSLTPSQVDLICRQLDQRCRDVED